MKFNLSTDLNEQIKIKKHQEYFNKYQNQSE